MSFNKSIFYTIIFSFILSGCATTTAKNSVDTPQQTYSTNYKKEDKTHLKKHNFIEDVTYSNYMSKRNNTINSELFSFFDEWKGVKYRMGGYTKKGIDCSGFVQKALLEKFDLQLPRDTRSQSLLGTPIKKSELQMGDLVFFKTGRTNHVGIYIENGKFMHASTKIGVTISALESDYFKKRFWKAQRVLK